MPEENQTLYLCAGLQCSGTTLISWCFLQRSDMDGILDGKSDRLADIPFPLATPFAWMKTTISSFRILDQMAHFQDLGWTIRPLLVCRDVREVYASLRTKGYGRNGTTAEDPPLRLRFRRFREDWDLFRQCGWPIVRFEDFLLNSEQALRSACAKLDLHWDEAMVTWPKPTSAILDARYGSETFHRSRGNDLWATIRSSHDPKKSSGHLSIPSGELLWLEKEFAQFNQENGYPEHILMKPTTAEEEDRAIPCFSVTRRFQWRLKRAPLRYLLYRISRWLKGKVRPAPRLGNSNATEDRGLQKIQSCRVSQQKTLEHGDLMSAPTTTGG